MAMLQQLQSAKRNYLPIGGIEMPQVTSTTRTWLAFNCVFLVALLALANSFSFSADKPKPETIRAVAMGTGTQMGQNANVTLTIYDFSTPEDQQLLVDAFQKGQNQGLAAALNKMKAVGRCEMAGTRGYDVSYIHVISTPTGRQIRFLTNRQIRNGEVATNSLSRAFDLTAGEINLDDTNKKKSTGFIYPAAQLVVNQAGEFQFKLNQNAWNLINILNFK